MFRTWIKSKRWLNGLTWLLTALAIVLLAGFLITFVRLRGTLSTDVYLSKHQELDGPRNIAQLQRELLRLQATIIADDSIITLPNSFSDQRTLVENQLLRLEEKGLLRFVGDDVKLKLKQLRTGWNALQPDLDAFQSDPQSKTVQSTLSQNLLSLELTANHALRMQSVFLVEQRIQIKKKWTTNHLRLGINNFLGLGALASALGLYILTQQQKRKVVMELRVRKQRLQTIVKTIPDVIVRVDYTGRIIDYEPNAQTDLGSSLFPPNNKSMVGRTIDELMRPQLAKELYQKLQTAFITGKSVRHEFWLDRDNDGNQAWFQASGTSINKTEAIIAIRDITEDKQHRKAVQKAQRMESLGMMAGGVAHSFNGALTVIQLNTSILQRKLAEHAHLNLKKHVDDISDAAVDTSNLTDQLLAYAGKSKLQTTRINLNQFVDEHDAIIQATVTKRRLYNVEQAEQIPSINADAHQLEQMLMNLLINAKDATENGTGCITVQTGTADLSDDNRPKLIGGMRITNGQYVTLEVQDNGTGISPYMHERIFEPYFSTDKENHSGLGLSATLGMMRSHSGGIELRSAVGEETTFCLYFPAHQKKRPSKHRKPLFPQ